MQVVRCYFVARAGEKTKKHLENFISIYCNISAITCADNFMTRDVPHSPQSNFIFRMKRSRKPSPNRSEAAAEFSSASFHSLFDANDVDVSTTMIFSRLGAGYLHTRASSKYEPTTTRLRLCLPACLTTVLSSICNILIHLKMVAFCVFVLNKTI